MKTSETNSQNSSTEKANSQVTVADKVCNDDLAKSLKSARPQRSMVRVRSLRPQKLKLGVRSLRNS